MTSLRIFARQCIASFGGFVFASALEGALLIFYHVFNRALYSAYFIFENVTFSVYRLVGFLPPLHGSLSVNCCLQTLIHAQHLLKISADVLPSSRFPSSFPPLPTTHGSSQTTLVSCVAFCPSNAPDCPMHQVIMKSWVNSLSISWCPSSIVEETHRLRQYLRAPKSQARSQCFVCR